MEKGVYNINKEFESTNKIIKLKKIPKIERLGFDEYPIKKNKNDYNSNSDDEKGSISGSDNSDPLVDYDVCKIVN